MVVFEIMVIICLVSDLKDLKKCLSEIVIGYNYKKELIIVGEMGYEGVLILLLKDVLKFNLV